MVEESRCVREHNHENFLLRELLYVLGKVWRLLEGAMDVPLVKKIFEKMASCARLHAA